jgi:hypothetical protein
VRARRLARSFLSKRASGDRLLEVVRSVCGVHAQVQASAELQLAARVDQITQTEVRDALWDTRTLVKAWTLRGTLHLHPADELSLWFAARRAVSGAPELPTWTDPQGVVHAPVSADEVTELRRAVWDSFAGRALLRDDLATEVMKRVGTKHEGRLRSGFAFFLSDVVQGPPQGTKITVARPDEWIRDWKEVDEREALREVLRRFLYAYGPSRPRAFRSWFGADVAFELANLEEVDVEGHRAFVLAGDTDFHDRADVLRLLPEYDVYVMGFRERDEFVSARVREHVASHGRGRYEGPAGVRFLLVDGLAAGLWERKKRGKRLELRVQPAGKLARAQRLRLDAEAERIGAFLGLEPELSVE